MKILSIFFTVASLALFFASCSNDNSSNDTPSSSSSPSSPGSSSSSSDQGNGAIERGICQNGEARQLYTNSFEIYEGSGKIYMKFGENSTALQIGSVNNGQVVLNFPQSPDTSFLRKFLEDPPETHLTPNGTQIWDYTDPLTLTSNNGEPIGKIRYYASTAGNQHLIFCWYFSASTTMTGNFYTNAEFAINAKKGWSQVYWPPISGDLNKFTTDLSNAPSAFNWVLWKD